MTYTIVDVIISNCVGIIGLYDNFVLNISSNNAGRSNEVNVYYN